MLLNYPKLSLRLEQVLGGDVNHQLSVINVKLYERFASVELKMKFEEGSIPPNFRKKSKNALHFFLQISDFRLSVACVSDEVSGNKVEEINSNRCIFCLGEYRYQFDAEKILFDTFQSVNEMDLVDQEWGRVR
jgi:hypothetical protein